jgi:phage-related protein
LVQVFEIQYYRTAEGKCPVEDYLDSLSDRQVEKVLWTLRVVRELNPVPAQYLQKLSGTHDLWEVRISHAGNIFRLLGFVTSERRLMLVHGFTKKTQKTPPQEMTVAAARKKDHETREKRKN